MSRGIYGSSDEAARSGQTICLLGAVPLTPKALTLLVHCTISFVLPNVRAKTRAEADALGRAAQNKPPAPHGQAWLP